MKSCMLFLLALSGALGLAVPQEKVLAAGAPTPKKTTTLLAKTSKSTPTVGKTHKKSKEERVQAYIKKMVSIPNPVQTSELCEACVAAEDLLIEALDNMTVAETALTATSSALASAIGIHDVCEQQEITQLALRDSAKALLVTKVSDITHKIDIDDANATYAESAIVPTELMRAYDWMMEENEYNTKVAECAGLALVVAAKVIDNSTAYAALMVEEANVLSHREIAQTKCDAMRASAGYDFFAPTPTAATLKAKAAGDSACTDVSVTMHWGTYPTENSMMIDAGTSDEVKVFKEFAAPTPAFKGSEMDYGTSTYGPFCMASGKHTFNLFDSYGDGWGGHAVVQQVGTTSTTELATLGADFANGFGQDVEVDIP